ncbi:conserved hypothetical protein [Deferribacter desulfuricans SSM1]|uniref:Uncharacterized protein n=1 Tax=Deferribacter desulfuricans (strain DSM 14783 / JCM 11476 / NBRC 101012 / SSM1) TaxID=639282 RepID=D3PD97_DEFDS|nr:hypothetical protein [Deferribacter desulfuricans]BAI80570.1 conserved hypothetical protein [Deferribacter desulfuricans SSM1]
MNKFVCSFDGTEIFPVFIDFNFEDFKCRGLSLLLDFFYKGRLTDLINSFNELKQPIFIKKDFFLFKSGFFLYDFRFIKNDIDQFVNFINNLGLTSIFIEKSSLLKDSDYDILSKRVDLTFLEIK